MTNFEFYKDKIFEISVNKLKAFAVVNGKPVVCGGAFCNKCEFVDDESCYSSRFKWLYSEHIEQSTLTSKERKLLEIIGTGYIARDANGTLWWYAKEPLKGRRTWLFDDRDANYGKLGYILDCFSFIKWEDEKPWAVEDLLKLEVTE